MKEIKGYTPEQFLHDNKKTFSGVNAGNYIEDDDFLNYSMPLYEENIKLHQQVEVLREALQDIVWWHTENLPDSTFDSILYKCKAALKQTEQ